MDVRSADGDHPRKEDTMARTTMTRRAALGKLAAAAAAAVVGAGMSALARQEAAVARDLDREFHMRVIRDRNGRAIKVCYYDRDFTLLYCDPV